MISFSENSNLFIPERIKLSNLENRLNAIISPEKRRLLEIEAIKKELIKDE
jgi:hypothetical protein